MNDKYLKMLGLMLIVLGIIVYGAKYIDSYKHSQEVNNKIAEELSRPTDTAEGKTPPQVDSENVERSVIDGKEMARTDAYERLSGVIRSDKIKLKEPIYKGASEVNMRKGVATLNVDDTLDQQLLSISGHRAPTPYTYFSEVLKLNTGDSIYIDHYGENGKEKEVEYTVTNKYLLKPTEREKLEKDVSVDTLQLITCDVWDSDTRTYLKRYVVEAEKVVK